MAYNWRVFLIIKLCLTELELRAVFLCGSAYILRATNCFSGHDKKCTMFYFDDMWSKLDHSSPFWDRSAITNPVTRLDKSGHRKSERGEQCILTGAWRGPVGNRDEPRARTTGNAIRKEI